jgi:hypothetical protein
MSRFYAQIKAAWCTGMMLAVSGLVGAIVLSLATFAAPMTGAAAAAGSSGTGQTSAGAGQSPAWSFVPLSANKNFLTRSSVHLIARPGETVSDTAVLSNYSAQTLNFDVYGSDAYNTRRLGAFTLNPPNIKPTGVGTWVGVPVNQYNLPPRTVTDFHFVVKVPANATPGDHAGGIVALNLAPNTNPSSGVQFNVQRGEGIAIYVRVPGPLHPALAASDIGASYSGSPLGIGSSSAIARYEVVNTGNEVLSGKAQLVATDIFGSTVHTFAPVPIVALIPGQRMDVIEPKWSDPPFIGPVHLNLTMTTTGSHSSGSAVFWIVPWLLILIIVLLIAALVVWWRRRRRTRGDNQTDGDSPVEADGTNAAELTEVESAPVP